jgi:hypothetical protein
MTDIEPNPILIILIFGFIGWTLFDHYFIDSDPRDEP